MGAYLLHIKHDFCVRGTSAIEKEDTYIGAGV